MNSNDNPLGHRIAHDLLESYNKDYVRDRTPEHIVMPEVY